MRKINFLEQTIKCDKLCLFPAGFKTIDTNVLPTMILYTYDTIYNLSRTEFDEFCKNNNEGINIFVIKGIKDGIYIHPNGSNRKLLHPEDRVNNAHIVRKEELDIFLKNIDNYNEYNIYTI